MGNLFIFLLFRVFFLSLRVLLCKFFFLYRCLRFLSITIDSEVETGEGCKLDSTVFYGFKKTFSRSARACGLFLKEFLMLERSRCLPCYMLISPRHIYTYDISNYFDFQDFAATERT